MHEILLQIITVTIRKIILLFLQGSILLHEGHITIQSCKITILNKLLCLPATNYSHKLGRKHTYLFFEKQTSLSYTKKKILMTGFRSLTSLCLPLVVIIGVVTGAHPLVCVPIVSQQKRSI